MAFQDVDVGQGNFYSLMFLIVALGNLVAYAIAGWAANVLSQVSLVLFPTLPPGKLLS